MHSAPPFQSHQNFLTFSHHSNSTFSSSIITHKPYFSYFKFSSFQGRENTRVFAMEERKFLIELMFNLSICLHKFMNSLCVQTISFLSVLSSDPLFSFIVSFCSLVYLYLPHQLWKIVLSPVLILTAILLLTILRLGAIQNSQHQQKENQDNSEPVINKENRASKCEEEKQSTSPIEPKSHEKVHQWVNSCSSSETELEIESQLGFKESSFFVEWDVTAPLEVIYEEYEGEEEEDEAGDDTNERDKEQNRGILRYPSLSRYYPESESDSSSENGFPGSTGDWDSPENICFRWDEEDREGLIEIALDGCKRKREMEFHLEEENMFEIDISPTRQKELSGEDKIFSGEISCN